MKVVGLNPIGPSAKIRDPSSMWGYQWPSDRKLNNKIEELILGQAIHSCPTWNLATNWTTWSNPILAHVPST